MPARLRRRDIDTTAALELEALGGYRDGDVVMAVEARNLVSEKAFAYIATHYWVCAFEREQVSWFNWAFSVSEPKPVPNPQMFWRRPTYAEAVRREEMFRDDPEHFRRCMEDYENHYGQYRLSEVHRRREPLRYRPSSWYDWVCLLCQEIDGVFGLVTRRRPRQPGKMCHRCGAMSDE